MNKVLDVAHELTDEEDIVLTQYELTTTYNAPDDIIADYIVTRDTLKALLSKGEYAMNKMILMLGEDAQPRTFEVFATMMKSIADISGELLDLQKQMKDMQTEGDGKDITGYAKEDDESVLNGTTMDLLDEINDKG